MPAPPSPPEKVRLHKALANAGVASRRDCEELITQGRIRVNGEPVHQSPVFVDPARDVIELDGEEVARPRRAQHRDPSVGRTYVMVNKPRGVISTVKDEPELREERKVITDLVKLPGNPRIYPVGRLDADSTGLILLTDDGEVTEVLTHPRHGVTKTYHVTVIGHVDAKIIEKINRGVFLSKRKATGPAEKHGPAPETEPKRRSKPVEVKVLRVLTDRSRGDRTEMSITLAEGQNREIRRLLARLGFKVRKLNRIRMGPLALKGLKPGNWRVLTRPEVNALRKLVKSADARN
jgi:pseudouridine synthase